jgi:hypothetical protein
MLAANALPMIATRLYCFMRAMALPAIAAPPVETAARGINARPDSLAVK